MGGRLVISFFSADDLQTLLDSMRVEDERAVVGPVFNGTEGSDEPAPVRDASVATHVDTPLQAAPDVAVVEGDAQQAVWEDVEPADEAVDDEPASAHFFATEEAGTVSHDDAPSAGPDTLPGQEEQAVADDMPAVQEEPALEEVLQEGAAERSAQPVDTLLQTLAAPDTLRTDDEAVADAVAAGVDAPADEPEREEGIGAVAPSPERPMPEPASAPTKPASAAQTDESDLYSIRNFSI